MKIISKKEAKSLDLNRYFTGKPCKHGHITERLIGGTCRGCNRMHPKNHPERSKKCRDENREIYNRKSREYYQRRKSAVSISTKKWAQANPEKKAKYYEQRRDLLNNATPDWSNDNIIKMIYIERNEMNKISNLTYHVDHIVPLNHPLVCGLHCEDNLQIIESSLNFKKSNRFDV